MGSYRGPWAAVGPKLPAAFTSHSDLWGGLGHPTLLPSLGSPQSFSAPRLALGSAKWVLKEWVSGIKDTVGFNTSDHVYGDLNKFEENCSHFWCTFFFFQGYFGAVGALLELLKIP